MYVNPLHCPRLQKTEYEAPADSQEGENVQLLQYQRCLLVSLIQRVFYVFIGFALPGPLLIQRIVEELDIIAPLAYGGIFRHGLDERTISD